MFLFFKGFDNNGGRLGPRSTRQNNPEEQASHYFNSFSKDMLVQVRFQAKCTTRSAMASKIIPKWGLLRVDMYLWGVKGRFFLLLCVKHFFNLSPCIPPFWDLYFLLALLLFTAVGSLKTSLSSCEILDVAKKYPHKLAVLVFDTLWYSGGWLALRMKVLLGSPVLCSVSQDTDEAWKIHKISKAHQ